MRLFRIGALIRRDYSIFMKSGWRWVEFLYFPTTTLVIWGFFAIWTGEFASVAGRVALVVNAFWSCAYIVQSTVNLSMNEDIWSGEIHDLYITGIGKWEYLLSRIIFGILITLLNLALMLTVMHFLFFNLSAIILPVIYLSILTIFSSIGLAILTAGFIFALGRKVMWLAWTTVQFFVLLSFPLSPLKILPIFFQAIARVMPYGELFEGVRNLLFGEPWTGNVVSASLTGLLYFLVAVGVYKWGFDYSRKSGKFAKMY